MHELEHIKLYVEADDLDGLKEYLFFEHSRHTITCDHILPALPNSTSPEVALCLLEYLIKLNKFNYSQLIEQINLIDELDEAQKHLLVSNLFRYAVLNQEFAVAESFIQPTHREDDEFHNKTTWNNYLLNQVNSQGIPLLQECFINNRDDDMSIQFLIEHGCNINQTDDQNNTLASLASTPINAHLQLLQYIVQNGGQWCPHPSYLLEQFNTPGTFNTAVRISGHLLHKNRHNQTVFELAIARRDDDKLRLLLNHVKQLVIEKAQVADAPTQLPVEQMRECSFILEYCLSIYNHSNDHVKNIFTETGLHLLITGPVAIYNQVRPLSQEQILFSQGLLDFFAEYQGRKLRPFYAHSLATNAVQAMQTLSLEECQQNISENEFRLTKAHKKAILSRDGRHYRQHRSDQKEHVRQQEVDQNNRIIQQHTAEAAREKATRLEQVRLQQEQEHNLQQAIAQAHLDARNELAAVPAQIPNVLETLTRIINARDKKKITKRSADWIFSSVTFITALSYFIRAALNRDDPNDEYSNLDTGAIALAVHWAIRFIMGTIDLDYASLKFNQLDADTRAEVTKLIDTLKSFQLITINLSNNTEVDFLIQAIWEASNTCKTRLETINRLLQSQALIIPQAITQPYLINYQWKNNDGYNRNGESQFFTYLCVVGLEGAVSLIGCYQYRSISEELEGSYDPDYVEQGDLHTPHKICFRLGGFVAIQLGVFPAYWLGKGFYHLGHGVGVLTKEFVAQHCNRLMTYRYNRNTVGNDSTMRPLIDMSDPESGRSSQQSSVIPETTSAHTVSGSHNNGF